ncbi:MAG: c-type cytochrome [Oligoflexus sp.]
MRLKHKVPAILAGAAMFFVLACNGENKNATKLQFMPDMADGPNVKPQEAPIAPPEHSMAINAIIYPENWEVAEREFRSPYRSGFGNYEEVLQHGEALYNTFCAVCHGEDGAGKGYLGDRYPIPVPDITREDLAQRADGYYFMQITKGGAMMPAYGHAISPLERWQIVAHIRKLQEK